VLYLCGSPNKGFGSARVPERERRPVLKVVPTPDRELSVGKVESGAQNLGVRYVLRQPWNLGVKEAGMMFLAVHNRLRISRLVACKQIARLFLVFLYPGTKRQEDKVQLQTVQIGQSFLTLNKYFVKNLSLSIWLRLVRR
jgi:hypothetical protein